MKKKIKDLTKKELGNICGKHLSQYCFGCPLLRPTTYECHYEYIQGYKKFLESEVEVDE